MVTLKQLPKKIWALVVFGFAVIFGVIAAMFATYFRRGNSLPVDDFVTLVSESEQAKTERIAQQIQNEYLIREIARKHAEEKKRHEEKINQYNGSLIDTIDKLGAGKPGK